MCWPPCGDPERTAVVGCSGCLLMRPLVPVRLQPPCKVGGDSLLQEVLVFCNLISQILDFSCEGKDLSKHWSSKYYLKYRLRLFSKLCLLHSTPARLIASSFFGVYVYVPCGHVVVIFVAPESPSMVRWSGEQAACCEQVLPALLCLAFWSPCSAGHPGSSEAVPMGLPAVTLLVKMAAFL